MWDSSGENMVKTLETTTRDTKNDSGVIKKNLVDHKDKDRISIKVCSYFDLDLSVCFLLGIVPTGRDIKDQSNIVEFL